MDNDLTPIFESWEYDSDNNIRIITSDDGRKIMQIRLPLGLEQYELNGRPDGSKPHNFPSLVDYLESEFVANPKRKISLEEFIDLQEEGLMMYNRYISLFQLGEYELTIRDTAHNLKLCDLIENHGTDLESKEILLQYRPYIIHINALARYMIAHDSNDLTEANKILDDAVKEIEALPQIDTPIFKIEKKRSVKNLVKAKDRVAEDSLSNLSLFELKLQEAVDNEQYEIAAQLRDVIKDMKKEDD